MTIPSASAAAGPRWLAGITPHIVLVTALAAGLATAPVAAETARFDLELNNLEDVDGECRVTFVAHNATGVALAETAYDVVVFDETGTVAQRLILEFGRLPDDKTRVVQFLLDRGCNRMSRLLLNGVEECRNEVGQSVPQCLDLLVTSSRVDVQFGS
jgi:hypothetical protein